MTPKSGVLLLLSCIAAIAGVGCVFEISSGEPDLGNTITSIILAVSIPLTALFFWAAVKDTRANYK
jgi:ABC-type Na+ efflux pump permease subunit